MSEVLETSAERRTGEIFLFILINLARTNERGEKVVDHFSGRPVKKESTSGGGKVREGEAQTKIYCEP